MTETGHHRMTDADLDRIANDLSKCRDNEDYENVAFYYLHLEGHDVDMAEIRFPKMLISALQHERTENARMKEWMDTYRDHLDSAIHHWRQRRDDSNDEMQAFAHFYVDAFQSARTSLFGETLPIA